MRFGWSMRVAYCRAAGPPDKLDVIPSSYKPLAAFGLSAVLAAVAPAPAVPMQATVPVQAAVPAEAPLSLSTCQIEHPLQLAVVAAECGVLWVAENPRQPGARHIPLRIARVPAISRAKRPDPLFVLAGGPGQAAGAFYVTVAGAFARILRERDIVLIDQRGTGDSNRLDCKVDEDFMSHSSADQIDAATRACLASLAPRADVAYYTTSLAVEDLERVRAALGYARINLYGSSYGTRVAQHYLRHYPQRVRSVILDGVVPVEAALGASAALDAQAALDAVLARCAGERACHGAFGDPAQDYHAVRAALSARAIRLNVPDPSSGVPTALEFGPEELATVLRLGTYSSDYAALLPLLLHEAGARENYTPLAAQFLMIERAYGQSVAAGMHNSVVCAEDVPFFDPRDVERTRQAAPYLGTTQIEGLKALCRLWPRGPVDADLHAPLESEVPALLLSGSADPVTPPAGARAAARAFPHSRSLLLEGLGHGQLTVPCMDRVMAQFVAEASVEQLDASCTRNARPLPFFISRNGPAP